MLLDRFEPSTDSTKDEDSNSMAQNYESMDLAAGVYEVPDNK